MALHVMLGLNMPVHPKPFFFKPHDLLKAGGKRRLQIGCFLRLAN